MARDVAIDVLRKAMVVEQYLKVERRVVSHIEQDAGDEKLVIVIVDTQAIGGLGRIAKVDKDLSRRLMQQEGVCEAAKRFSRCFIRFVQIQTVLR